MNDELPFTNPYDPAVAREAGKQMSILNTPIYLEHATFFKLIRPALGTITTTCAILWKKLYDELNERNITDHSNQSEFEHFVTSCRLITREEWDELQQLRSVRGGRGLSLRPIGGTLPASSSGNDRGGDQDARDDGSANASVVSNVQSRSGTRRRKASPNKEGQNTNQGLSE